MGLKKKYSDNQVEDIPNDVYEALDAWTDTFAEKSVG